MQVENNESPQAGKGHGCVSGCACVRVSNVAKKKAKNNDSWTPMCPLVVMKERKKNSTMVLVPKKDTVAVI